MTRPVRVGNPLVFADALEHEDGRSFAWFLSRDDEPTEVKPAVTAGLALRTLDGSEG